MVSKTGLVVSLDVARLDVVQLDVVQLDAVPLHWRQRRHADILIEQARR
jgi:hypothetical protein